MIQIGAFQIEAKSIPQTRNNSKTEWFVDVRKPLEDGGYTLVGLRSFDTADAAERWCHEQVAVAAVGQKVA